MTRDGFAAHIVDGLSGLGDVSARAMFGGHGIYLGETIFAIVYEDRLYLKVDEHTRPAFEADGMGPFRPNDKQTMKSYYEAPGEVIDDPDELVAWAKAAVDAARKS